MGFRLLIIAGIAANLFGSAGLESPVSPISLKAVAKKNPVQQLLVKGHSLAFIENRGQFDHEVKFRAQSGNKVLWFTDTGIVFDLVRPADIYVSGPKTQFPPASARRRSEADRLIFFEKFANGRDRPQVEASAARPGIYNYFIGNDPKKWRTGVMSYSQILYREVWPGVDVRFVAKGSDIEQEFLVHPGADVASIHVQYSGIDSLDTPNDGSLLVQTKFGPLRESPPRIYQEVDGQQTSVPGRYLMSGNLGYAFKLGGYSSNRDLVIDPTLLFSTYIGAGGNDIGRGIAVDASGNTYIAGATQGSTTPYPTTPGAFQSTPPNATSAVVSKFDPVGNLAYSTYLGSPSGGDNARGIAVDPSGEAYITGVGYQGFPTTTNALQQSCGSSSFVSKLNAAGNALLYSTCVGNEGYSAEYGSGVNAIAEDGAGRAYITGLTADSAFPVTSGGFQRSLPDQQSAFVSVIDPSLSGSASLVYSTYLGGEAYDNGTAITVDSSGAAYVTGFTSSLQFPVSANAFQIHDQQNNCYPEPNSGDAHRCSAGFVTKLDPALIGASSLIYSTYLSGSVGAYNAPGFGDIPAAIAVDPSGNAYIAGSTSSPNFPTTVSALQPLMNCVGPGQNTGFVSKLDSTGQHLLYSTFLSGSNNISCGTTGVTGVAVSALGNAYATGRTQAANFPVTTDALQPESGGGNDAFLIEFTVDGSSAAYSTFLGGSGDDGAMGIALDVSGNILIAGNTTSTNFPVSAGAFQSTLMQDPTCSCQDIFVVKLLNSAALQVQTVGPNIGGNAGTVTVSLTGSGFSTDTSVTLVCPSASIKAQNVAFESQLNILATFNLVGVPPEACSLQVLGIGGSFSTLPASFTVQQGGASNVYADFIGRAVIRAGQQQTFFVVVGNRGNIDANQAGVWLQIPSVFSYALLPSTQTPTSSLQVGTDTLLYFELANALPVSTTVTLPISLQVPDIPQYAHYNFQIQVWASVM